MIAPALRIEIRARYVDRRRRPAIAVARLVGAAISQEVRPPGGAAQYAYYAGIRWTGIEFFVAERTFAGVFPTHDGRHVSGSAPPPPTPEAVRRTSSSRVDGVRRAAGSRRPHSWPSGCARPAGPRRCGHAPPAQPDPPGVRPRLGSGRGRRLLPRRRHRPRHQRRVPRRRAAWPSRLTRRCPAVPMRPRRSAAYQQQRDQALREIFEITCQPGGLSAGADVHRTAEAAGRRHRQGGRGAGRSAGPGRAPARDRLTAPPTGRRRPLTSRNRSNSTHQLSQPTPRRLQHDHHRHARHRASTTRCATAWTRPPSSPPSTR